MKKRLVMLVAMLMTGVVFLSSSVFASNEIVPPQGAVIFSAESDEEARQIIQDAIANAITEYEITYSRLRKPTAPIDVNYVIKTTPFLNRINLQYTYHMSSGVISYVKNPRLSFDEGPGVENELVYLETWVSGQTEITTEFTIETTYYVAIDGFLKLFQESTNYTVIHDTVYNSFDLSIY